MSIIYKKKLPNVEELRGKVSLSKSEIKHKEVRDLEMKHIFTGESKKFIVIVGPCSADNEKAVIDYANKLMHVQQQTKDKLMIIPRIYTSKPRTTCQGYKGMIHQPDLHQAENLKSGIEASRRLHTKVIRETGLTCADELLYVDCYKYFKDVVSYFAIGARSVENQHHRLLASALDLPVGMKNPISGDMNVTINSICAAQNQNVFGYDGWELHSLGNPFAHAILRGAFIDGQRKPNYYSDSIKQLYELYLQYELKNKSVIIDANHDNSGKQHLEQINICKDVMKTRSTSTAMRDFIKGIMIESYLMDGKQLETEKCYGKSVTDACLGWEKTEQLLYEIANMV